MGWVSSLTASTAPPADILGVPVRLSVRARRMALRADTRTGQIILVLPHRQRWTATRLRAAEEFITQNDDWIKRHDRSAGLSGAMLAPGDELQVMGKAYKLVHRPGRGLGMIEGDSIIVRGDIAHFNRRLRDFIKSWAADVLPARVADKTRQLGLTPREVRLRDPATRWGSCGSDGRIMLSWRLVLLPEEVMDYVVAHEVAHRVHMDHSRAFWRLCLSLTTNGQAARRWLRQHGATVMRI